MSKSTRFVGIDVGAETIKVVELSRATGEPALRWTRRAIAEHHKDRPRFLPSFSRAGAGPTSRVPRSRVDSDGC